MKPSQELIGLIEENWRSNKFKWVHVGTVRHNANADTEDQSEGLMKNIFRRHTTCFLQRVETLLNAFLLLSYENWDPATQPRSALILTKEYANLYMDHLRRYCSIAGNEDPMGYGSEVIHDMDKKMRNEWQEAPPSTNGIPTRLDDIIAEQLNNKMSKAEFVCKLKETKNRNASEGVDSTGAKRIWRNNTCANLITKPQPKNQPQRKDSWNKPKWNEPKKNDSNSWKKNDWSNNKRPSQNQDSEPSKKQKQEKNKGVACPFKEQCRFKDSCRMAHSFEEIMEYQSKSQ